MVWRISSLEEYISAAKSRNDIRKLAYAFRKCLKKENDKYFPIVETLDALSEMCDKFNYEIVENDKIKSKSVHAYTDIIAGQVCIKQYTRKEMYGFEWDTVDINDVVNVIAPGATPVIDGGKIKYYNADGTMAVVADISGYLRVEKLQTDTKKKQYLDQFGNDAHNVKDERGKIHGRSKSDFQKATHYIIKKKKEGD